MEGETIVYRDYFYFSLLDPMSKKLSQESPFIENPVYHTGVSKQNLFFSKNLSYYRKRLDFTYPVVWLIFGAKILCLGHFSTSFYFFAF